MFEFTKITFLTHSRHKYFWPAKFEVIIIINSDFQALNLICVWAPTRIDLKFSGDLQGIQIYSQKLRFCKKMFWLKVITQKTPKLLFFSCFSSFDRHLRVNVNSDHKSYWIETWHDCLRRQMMASCKIWRHKTIWSWNNTLKCKIIENADQAFLGVAFCLNSQKWRFWRILGMLFQFPSKKLGISTIFGSTYFWPAKFKIIIIITPDFQTSSLICVWTLTRIDLKVSGDLQGIKIYSI